MTDSDPGTVPRPSKHRSPNHPAFTLEKALAKAGRLLDKARLSPVPVPVACEYIGVKATSSSGMRWLATLQEYGLVRADGRGKGKTLTVTDTARTILKHPDKESSEYKSALRKAALTPTMHQRVWDLRTEGCLPPDESLRYTLSSPEWGFSEQAAEAFVAQLRETIAFAELTEPECDTREEEDEVPANREEGSAEPHTTGPHSGVARKQSDSAMNNTRKAEEKEIPIPLQSGGTAILSLPYLLDEADYEWMRLLLKGLKRSMLASAAPTPSKSSEDEEAQ